MDKNRLRLQLATFTSPDAELRHWTNLFSYTRGVAFLADEAGAHWLLDHIAARQKRARKDRQLRETQIWIVRRMGIRSVRIACCRGPADEAFHDDLRLLGEFPLEEATLWLEAETLMLPSERS